ncbi:MAG TPA: tetratricopeptide repeat protein [Pyrinomonadaceae bacterium]|nr:tetratricopeptide repeat protein [Pyrinomonadaceae bacterium]
MTNSFPRVLRYLCISLVLLLPNLYTVAIAQDTSDAERERALKLLWEEAKAGAALPLLEKLAKERPTDGMVAFSYGFALLAKVRLQKDAALRKQTRIEARTWLVKARDLGVKDALLTSLLESLPKDGGNDDVFSSVKEADDAMRDGETLYVNGQFVEAAEAYQRALKADPKLYEAALFAGDMYLKAGQNEKAAEWFTRAQQISPDRETAYRYSATPFLRAGKLDEAKTRYIDAVIAEPYNRLTWNGLNQWAEAAGVRLGHPQVDVPKTVKSVIENNVHIAVDPNEVDLKSDVTGTSAWTAYGRYRTSWLSTEFAKAYPNETSYRHSLREEVAALQGVIELVKQQQKANKITRLDMSLANLVKLSDEGLLEPFILYALVDRGIAQDYSEYRKANRDKLRRYLVEYVTAR